MPVVTRCVLQGTPPAETSLSVEPSLLPGESVGDPLCTAGDAAGRDVPVGGAQSAAGGERGGRRQPRAPLCADVGAAAGAVRPAGRHQLQTVLRHPARRIGKR